MMVYSMVVMMVAKKGVMMDALMVYWLVVMMAAPMVQMLE